MCEKNLVSGSSRNDRGPKHGEQQDRGQYRAPRLVVIGTAVELVQGGIGRNYDGQRCCGRP